MLRNLKLHEWINIYQDNGRQKRAGIAILIMQLRNNSNSQNKGKCLILKATIHNKDITLMNTYASNNIAATVLKQPKKEMPGDISSNIQKKKENLLQYF